MSRKKKQLDEQKQLDDAFDLEAARATLELIFQRFVGAMEGRPLPSADDPIEFLPLTLTDDQRESIIKCTQLRKRFKKEIQDLPLGTHTIEMDRQVWQQMTNEVGRAAAFAVSPHKERLLEVLQQLESPPDVPVESPPHELAEAKLPFPWVRGGPSSSSSPSRHEAESAGLPSRRRKVLKKTGLLYQFKVTLLEIEPVIWRRIQVPDCTLDLLSAYLQAAFGWDGYHMHAFEIGDRTYGPPIDDGFAFGNDMEDETEVLISSMISTGRRRKRWIYEYDFGDSWRHEVLFESNPERESKVKYPRCTDGARACPPEDCGGAPGFLDLLDAIDDPEHEAHEEVVECYGRFDPDKFDAKKATRDMRRER